MAVINAWVIYSDLNFEMERDHEEILKQFLFSLANDLLKK
jgi:hypothetical protein